MPYVLGASAIDKVQITAIPVPLKNQWGWWLSISGYGQQLWALLQVNSVGGFYIGGSPILTSFRGYGFSGFGSRIEKHINLDDAIASLSTENVLKVGWPENKRYPKSRR